MFVCGMHVYVSVPRLKSQIILYVSAKLMNFGYQVYNTHCLKTPPPSPLLICDLQFAETADKSSTQETDAASCYPTSFTFFNINTRTSFLRLFLSCLEFSQRYFAKPSVSALPSTSLPNFLRSSKFLF